jgi:hypothetical protein
MNYLFLFIGLIAGLIIVNLFRLNKALGKHKQVFSLAKFAKDNMISTAIVLVFGSILIIDPTGMNLIQKFIPNIIEFQMSAVYMMVFGMSGDVIIKGIKDALSSKKKTAIGVN